MARMNHDRLKLLLSDGSAGGFVVSEAPSLNLNLKFISRISLLLTSRDWVNPVLDPMFPEKCL